MTFISPSTPLHLQKTAFNSPTTPLHLRFISPSSLFNSPSSPPTPLTGGVGGTQGCARPKGRTLPPTPKGEARTKTEAEKSKKGASPMTPYSVTIHRPDIGKRQCCLKAPDAEAARHRVKTRTYPGCTILEVKRREISPPGKIGATPSRVSNARANLVKAQAVQRATRQEKIDEVARLVAEGISQVSHIAARIGHPYSTTCKYVNAAADQGKIVALYTGQGQTAVLKAVQ